MVSERPILPVRAVIVPTTRKDATTENNEFMSPFWLVGSTTDPDKANMMFLLSDVAVPTFWHVEGPFGYPVMANSVPVEQGDELLFYRAPQLSKWPSAHELRFHSANG